MRTQNPSATCACGDPVNRHADPPHLYCLRWECGCTRFTTPEEMEAFQREYAVSDN